MITAIATQSTWYAGLTKPLAKIAAKVTKALAKLKPTRIPVGKGRSPGCLRPGTAVPLDAS